MGLLPFPPALRLLSHKPRTQTRAGHHASERSLQRGRKCALYTDLVLADAMSRSFPCLVN